MGFDKAPLWRWPLAVPIALRGFYNGFRLANPRRKPLPADARAQAIAAFGTVEDFEVQTRDGITIRGWYVAPKDGAVVILGSGGFTNRMQMLPEARLLASRGFGVVLFDWRACGSSGGERSDWGRGEQDDLSAIIDHLATRAEVTRIGAFGFSIAANVVAVVAARDQRLRSAVLHAAWTSHSEEFAYKMGKYGTLSSVPGLWAFRLRGLDLFGLRPIDTIAQISPRPISLMAADRDFHTPLEMTQRLYAAAGEPKELWIMPGSTHIPYHDDSSIDAPRAKIGRHLVEFFERTLRGECQAAE